MLLTSLKFFNKKNEIKGIKIVIIIIAYVFIIIISGSINFGVNLKYNPALTKGINKGWKIKEALRKK
tara:strand:+ start:86 stop:286 length:201 start_codon:yes stop_codon:yes gene_type:complete